jgi:hypothetical protein
MVPIGTQDLGDLRVTENVDIGVVDDHPKVGLVDVPPDV